MSSSFQAPRRRPEGQKQLPDTWKCAVFTCTLKVDTLEHSNRAENLVARLSLHKPPVASAEAGHLRDKGAPKFNKASSSRSGLGPGRQKAHLSNNESARNAGVGGYVMESGKKLVFALPVCSAKNRDTLRISAGLVRILWFGPAFQNVPEPSGRARGAHRTEKVVPQH